MCPSLTKIGVERSGNDMNFTKGKSDSAVYGRNGRSTIEDVQTYLPCAPGLDELDDLLTLMFMKGNIYPGNL